MRCLSQLEMPSLKKFDGKMLKSTATESLNIRDEDEKKKFEESKAVRDVTAQQRRR